ncbi:interleukin-17 receptor C isoform X6 [Cavia porcellus]|uniref:interleukin-17 receptor C isoform X6 n=1 Tax=Cavia porcellus TaxID=10141 RepID=UPI002FE3DCDA
MKSRPYSRPTPPTSAPRKSQAHWLSGVAGAPTWVLNSFSSPTLHSSTDNDVLCLPGSIESAPGPVLVPTYLQTELVLRCHQETSCDLCVRVTVHLAVHILSGHREEPEDKKWGGTAEPELKEPGNASLQAQVVLSFQAYPTARCVLLEVQVPAARVRPGQSVEAPGKRLGTFYDPSTHLELCSCHGLCKRSSLCQWALWYLIALRLLLELRFKSGPTLSLGTRRNSTSRSSCLVWPLQPDPVRTSICPFKEDPRAHRNLWRAAHLRLLSPRSWRLDAPCSLPAEVTLCWQSPGGDPCQPLTPPLSPENVTVNTAIKFPVLKGHPNLCVQVRSWKKVQLHECLWSDSLGPLKDDVLLVEIQGPHDNRSLCALEPSGCTPLPSRAATRAARLGEQLLQDLHAGQCLQLWDDDVGALWACPLDKYTHKRWALVWLASLLLLAAAFLLLLLLRKDRGKATAGIRAALLLYSADDAAFERLVGALASALSRLPLGVAVDLWSRRELSAQGPVAWLHARRRQTLQERGVVVLLFSPGAVALCRQWLQGGPPVPGAHGPHDAFAASLSCVLPDFLQGRAPGRYVGACFDGLLAPDAVPAPFHAAPLFSLPSQLRGFLGALQGPHAARFGRLEDSAEQVARALRPVLDSCFQPPRLGMGPEAGAGLE